MNISKFKRKSNINFICKDITNFNQIKQIQHKILNKNNVHGSKSSLLSANLSTNTEFWPYKMSTCMLLFIFKMNENLI